MKPTTQGCGDGRVTCSPAVELCKCSSCGYEWERGKNGSHSCTDNLHKLIAAMLPVLRFRIDAIPRDSEYAHDLRAMRDTAEMVAWRYASQANALNQATR